MYILAVLSYKKDELLFDILWSTRISSRDYSLLLYLALKDDISVPQSFHHSLQLPKICTVFTITFMTID
jgi:hypothetical protein